MGHRCAGASSVPSLSPPLPQLQQRPICTAQAPPQRALPDTPPTHAHTRLIRLSHLTPGQHPCQPCQPGRVGHVLTWLSEGEGASPRVVSSHCRRRLSAPPRTGAGCSRRPRAPPSGGCLCTRAQMGTETAGMRMEASWSCGLCVFGHRTWHACLLVSCVCAALLDAGTLLVKRSVPLTAFPAVCGHFPVTSVSALDTSDPYSFVTFIWVFDTHLRRVGSALVLVSSVGVSRSGLAVLVWAIGSIHGSVDGLYFHVSGSPSSR